MKSTRRATIKMFAVSALALGLSACGGGSDGDTGSSNGDLYAAFDKTAQGMTYEQVRDIVGFEYNHGKDDFQGDEIHYKWITGKGTTSVVILQVNFTKGKASAKIVGGYKGNFSKFW